MEQQDMIDVGSVVTVRFAMNPPITGEVLGTPAATGDCWKIRGDGGSVFYVQQFDSMQKHMHG